MIFGKTYLQVMTFVKGLFTRVIEEIKSQIVEQYRASKTYLRWK